MNNVKALFTIIAGLSLLWSCDAPSTADHHQEALPSLDPVPVVWERIERADFKVVLDSAQLVGSILIANPQNHSYWSNDFVWAERGHLPASTFKIPNSMIALETGIVEDGNTLFRWDGKPRRLAIWNRDMIFKEAFQLSCVPCYQDIARQIGPMRMREFLDRFEYGHMVFDSTSIDQFWLEGPSTISQFQQVEFLQRLFGADLPVALNTIQVTKEIMLLDDSKGYKLSGKTGWGVRDGNDNGWFVGFVETNGAVYFFATNVEPLDQSNTSNFAAVRKNATMRALQLAGVIP